MENTNKTRTASEYKSYSLETTPWYFGVYLNLARLNLYMINNHIAKRTTCAKELANTEHILNVLYLNEGLLNKNINNTYLFDLLVRHLPLTKSFNDEKWALEFKTYDKEVAYKGWTAHSVSEIATCYKHLLSKMNELRNFTSHYHDLEYVEPLICSTEFQNNLQSIYNKALSLVQSHYQGFLEAKDLELAIHIKDELFNKGVMTNRGLAFYCSLFLDKESMFHLLGRLYGFKRSGNLDNEQTYFAVREVFSVFCVKPPHVRLTSSDLDGAYKMDLINYLCRVPKELYQVLSDDDKALFEPKHSLLALKNIAENSINNEMVDDVDFDYDEYIRETSSMRRSENRFPYFALQFLDRMDSFTYNFNIKVGKGIIDSYTKKVGGEVPDAPNRYIHRELTCHQKLNDLLKYKELFKVWQENPKENDIANSIPKKEYNPILDFKNATKKLLNKSADKGGLTLEQREELFIQSFNYVPQYDICGNKIGIAAKNINMISPKQPEAFISINELHKVVLLELLQPKSTSSTITKYLDNNKRVILNHKELDELRNKLGYSKSLTRFAIDEKAAIDNDKKKKYQIYKNEYASRKDKLDKQLVRYGLKVNQLPQRVTDYLLNIEPVEEDYKIKEYIKRESERCKNYVKGAEKHKLNLKIGEMASILSRDIVSMVITKKQKEKFTSFYYNLLQSYLATWSVKSQQQLFWEIIGKDLNLLSGETAHPILDELKNKKMNTTKDFFRAYFECKGFKLNYKKERIDWLSKTFYHKIDGKTKVGLPIDCSNIPYTYIRKAEGAPSISAWINNVENMNRNNKKKSTGEACQPYKKPIDLPIGLFDDELKKALSKTVTTSKSQSISKMMSLYCGDALQQMYYFDKHYKLFSDKSFEANVIVPHKLNRKLSSLYQYELDRTSSIRENEGEKFQKEGHKRAFKTIDDNEKTIRYYQLCDRISLLMLKNLLQNNDLTLTEFKPNKGEGILNTTINVYERLTNGCIIEGSCKRRDYGKFKRVLHDTRINTFTKGLKSYEYNALVEELNSYNRNSVLIFEQILTLEYELLKRKSFDGVNYPDDFKSKGNPNFRKVIGNGLLKSLVCVDCNSKSFKDFVGTTSVESEESRTPKNIFDTKDEFYDSCSNEAIKRGFMVTLIRNKFSHNQYPPKEFMDIMIEEVKQSGVDLTECKSYADYILLYLKQTIEKLLTLQNKK